MEQAGAPALEARCSRVPVLGVCELNFHWKKTGGKKMFLVEERQKGERRAEIYMRPDGLFEGRIYRPEVEMEFEICGVTETLPRVETLVDEELDR